jgi:outer membrane protein assembly factor BamB
MGLGEGFSSVSVAGGRVYTQGNRNRQEAVFAVEESSGKLLWAKDVAPARAVRPPGSRSTPTVSGDRLYVETVAGDVLCLDADGREVWRVSMVQEFGGGAPRWGYSESPLVDGDRVICTPGASGAMMVALEKTSGKTIWKATAPHADAANYASPVVAQAGGVRQYVQLLYKGAVGVAADGEFLWRAKFETRDPGYNCNTPLVADGMVVLSNQASGATFRIPGPGVAEAQRAYEARGLESVHSGYVRMGDHVYGGNFRRDSLVCVDFKTGRLAWQDPRPGMCAIVAAEGHLYLRNEKGPFLLVEATPEGYREKGRFDPPDRTGEPAWAHPAIANGRLYLRDQDVLLCYDIGESKR